MARLRKPKVLALMTGTALAAVALSPAFAGASPAPHGLSAAANLINAEITHGSHATQPRLTGADAKYKRACAAVTATGHASCSALVRDGITARLASTSPGAIPAGYGYGPSQLQAAYDLTAASAADGAGRTIALVDAYNDPTAESDLATYRSAAGLPPVPSFKQVNQNGQTTPLPALSPPAPDDWTQEESLDLDMASATCPLCNIVLVEADSDSGDGLYIAENTAASMAGYISNSWGGTESSSDSTYDSEYFNHPGDVITASAGDYNYSKGVEYPSTSPNVVSVGGTSLSTASNSRGWTESVWSDVVNGTAVGTQSGCSAYEPQPSWQAALNLPAGCSNRIANDVSADADPLTGVAIYDTSNGNGGWMEEGGTSAASPMIAAMYALAGNAGDSPADDIYTHTGDFYDVTSGSNGTCSPAYLCTGEVGYDAPTGIGTPDGLAGLQQGGSSTGTANTVTVANPGNQTGVVGTAASLQVSATDSASGQTLTYSATGLPAGLSISSSGLISGTATAAGTSTVTVTATDSTGAAGTTSFTWTVSAKSGGATITVTNPGELDWFTDYAYYGTKISASDSESLPLTFSATGLPAGLDISSSGEITGTPTAGGTFTVKVTATDTAGSTGSTTFTFVIYTI